MKWGICSYVIPFVRVNFYNPILAVENYLFGGKDGLQEYFNFLGGLQRQEEWRGYNPDVPFDTIPVYGKDNNEILSYKILKSMQYSVPDGVWKYFNAAGGLVKSEKYDRGFLLNSMYEDLDADCQQWLQGIIK